MRVFVNSLVYDFILLQVDYYCQVAKSLIGPATPINEWWAVNGSQFPMLQLISRRYLSVNPTSTASERIFSIAGNIATKKRNRLKPSNVDMLTCLAYNIRCNPDILK